jgi:hypothetical protein
MKKLMILSAVLAFAAAPLLAAPRGATMSKKKAAKREVREEAPAPRQEAPRQKDYSSGGARNLITLSPVIYSDSSTAGGVSVGGGGIRLTLGYEFALSEENSVLARIPIELSGRASGPSTMATAAFGIGGGYRWYLIGGNLSGLYVNPLLVVQSSTLTDTFAGRTYVTNALLFKVAGEAGYQARVWQNLYVGGNLELGYVTGTYTVAVPGASAATVGNLGLGTSAHVGWAF